MPVPANLVQRNLLNPISGIVDNRSIKSDTKRLKTISCYLEDSHVQAKHRNKLFEKGINIGAQN